MKYERLSYLSVTFTEGERTRTVHLTPVTERSASPGDGARLRGGLAGGHPKGGHEPRRERRRDLPRRPRWR